VERACGYGAKPPKVGDTVATVSTPSHPLETGIQFASNQHTFSSDFGSYAGCPLKASKFHHRNAARTPLWPTE
jgi:hypothetical protein